MASKKKVVKEEETKKGKKKGKKGMSKMMFGKGFPPKEKE